MAFVAGRAGVRVPVEHTYLIGRTTMFAMPCCPSVLVEAYRRGTVSLGTADLTGEAYGPIRGNQCRRRFVPTHKDLETGLGRIRGEISHPEVFQDQDDRGELLDQRASLAGSLHHQQTSPYSTGSSAFIVVRLRAPAAPRRPEDELLCVHLGAVGSSRSSANRLG